MDTERKEAQLNLETLQVNDHQQSADVSLLSPTMKQKWDKVADQSPDRKQELKNLKLFINKDKFIIDSNGGKPLLVEGDSPRSHRSHRSTIKKPEKQESQQKLA